MVVTCRKTNQHAKKDNTMEKTTLDGKWDDEFVQGLWDTHGFQDIVEERMKQFRG